MKSKALSLFHLNVGFLPKQFDNFEYLINQLQIQFDFIGVTESRLIKGKSPTTNNNLKDYVIEHTSTEPSGGGAVLYINKKYSNSSVKWTALAHPSPKLNKTTSSPKPSGPF